MTQGRVALAGAALLATVLLVALGIWQVERRRWKLDLIARVEARLAAAPVTVPKARWGGIGRDDAYTRVRFAGHWLPATPVLVKAVTAFGAGWWVIAPLATAEGVVLVNRGFVPEDLRDRPVPSLQRRLGSISGGCATRGRHGSEPSPGRRSECDDSGAMVTGLLRISEPGGAFLRANDPKAGRWFSRDVPAIARARGWNDVAPFFVDADEAPGRPWPRGGLTVVRFSNNHLVYALTWFALAALAGWFAWRVLRENRE